MQIKLRTLTLRIDLLMLLFPILAICFGGGRTIGILLLSLAVHELAHWGVSRAVGVAIHSIRLTPFGGMARMENPYAIPPLRLCAVAAAGPAANLLVILLTAALCQWRLIAPIHAAECIQTNALLLVFNLLPALPLDGGRMLYALLSRFLPGESALRICLWAGRILAILLILSALAGFALYRRLNLSFLFVAVFLLASASDEHRALTDSRTQSFVNSLRPLTRPTPARIVAIDASMPPATVLRASRPDCVTLFAVYKNGRLDQITDDRTLVSLCLAPDTPVEKSEI